MEYDFRRRRESALSVRRLWRRRRSSAASDGGLRCRLGLLAVTIAALASMASGPPPLNGVDLLGLTDDGAVVATVTGGVSPYLDAETYGSYISRDGGMSWSLSDEFMYALDEFQSGEYAIDELGVSRLGADGRREIVYSTEYLRGDANVWMQDNDTQKLALGHRFLATRPRAVIYHPESGSVIAAMGIQGVAVGTPDGRWHRVAVGVFAPTDFSFSAKTRALMESGGLVGAIALSLSLSALTAAVAASAYRYDARKDGAAAMFASICILAAVGALWATMDSIGKGSVVGGVVALVGALTSWTTTLIIVVSKPAAAVLRKLALLGCVAPLPISFGLLLSFEFFDAYYRPSVTDFRIALSIAALISLIPPLACHARFIARRWRPFALAFAGMNALIALAFALWLQMNVSLAATQIAIAVLVGLAAVVLVRHVRGGRRDVSSGSEGG